MEPIFELHWVRILSCFSADLRRELLMLKLARLLLCQRRSTLQWLSDGLLGRSSLWLRQVWVPSDQLIILRLRLL